MPAGLSVLLSPLQGLLNTFQSERHYKDDKKDAALLAINQALIETKRYIESDAIDREREFALAHLWAEAATKSRYASEDVATRLHNKSLYWSENLKWSREEVLTRKIDLDSIEEQLRILMKP